MAGGEIESLVALLKVAEELLFAMPLPDEVVSKYEFVRAKTFAKCKVSYNGSHIRRLQIEAQAKNAKESSRSLNNSNIEHYDIELRANLQESAVFIQKLIVLLEKSIKTHQQTLKNCENLIKNERNFETAQKSIGFNKEFDLYKNDLEIVYENYRNLVESCDIEIKERFKALQASINTQSASILRLESQANASSNDLNRNHLELVEKYEILQERYVKEKSDHEKKVKQLRDENLSCKSSYLNEARKSQMKEVEKIIYERDSFKEEANSLRSKLSEATDAFQRQTLELNEEHGKYIEELNQHLTTKYKSLEVSLKAKIEDLEKTLYYTEQDFLQRFHSKVNDSDSKISSLEKSVSFYKASYESLNNLTEIVQEFLSKIFQRHSEDKFEEGDRSSTLISQMQFLDETLEKLSTDNMWLLDRLAEFRKENEELKLKLTSNRLKDSFTDLDTSSFVIKNFEKSRQKLKQQLFESSQYSDKSFS